MKHNPSHTAVAFFLGGAVMLGDALAHEPPPLYLAIAFLVASLLIAVLDFSSMRKALK